MKKNIIYLSIIILLLVCEIFAYAEEKQLYQAFWGNFFKFFSWITFGIWYYHEEKNSFGRIQKVFLISNLLSIFTTLSYYFFTLNEGLSLIFCVSIGIFCLWIYVFRLMGARIVFNKNDDLLKKIVPVFFTFPIAYYFLTLYPILTISYAILKLLFTLTLSYACLLSIFLPINYHKKLWITSGIILFIYISLLYSNYLFIENKMWSYVISRIAIVVSRCMMVYGMIHYVEKTHLSSVEDD